MKLRLTQPGWETYCGQMGVIQFVDGLSAGDVLEIDAVRMGAVMRCEWESGAAANVAQHLLDRAGDPAPSPEAAKEKEIEKVKAAAPAAKQYSREDLARVADVKGINGIREIADALGIKGNSIRGLIESILTVNDLQA